MMVNHDLPRLVINRVERSRTGLAATCRGLGRNGTKVNVESDRHVRCHATPNRETMREGKLSVGWVEARVHHSLPY